MAETSAVVDEAFDEPRAAAAKSRRHSGAGGGALPGLVAGIAVLLGGIGFGGTVGSFFDVPSLLIVVGGTLAMVSICFPMREVRTMLGCVIATITEAAPDPRAAALRALRLAEDARRHGLLHLEERAAGEVHSAFLRKALAMVADGTGEAELEAVLRHDVLATPERLRRSAAVLRRAADYAPAMGLIGTLIGLVQMLGQLSDPHRIGPSMAVALLTTFYGAVLANMVCSPLAVKLERWADDEEMICLMFLMGVVSISRQENPRRLELLLNSVLPPGKRVRYFEG
ncbi:MAG TPA: MotA/TolQ/ExbB proton channel family protein [Rhodospirillales bacterium]|nr:MotA/TolQ/ExbB proton channel family protein [Rhodospirillales bacterium]